MYSGERSAFTGYREWLEHDQNIEFRDDILLDATKCFQLKEINDLLVYAIRSVILDVHLNSESKST